MFKKLAEDLGINTFTNVIFILRKLTPVEN